MTKGQRAAGIAFASLIAVVGLILLIFVPAGGGPDRGFFGALEVEGKMLGLLAFLSSLVMIGVFAFSQRGDGRSVASLTATAGTRLMDTGLSDGEWVQRAHVWGIVLLSVALTVLLPIATWRKIAREERLRQTVLLSSRGAVLTGVAVLAVVLALVGSGSTGGRPGARVARAKQNPRHVEARRGFLG